MKTKSEIIEIIATELLGVVPKHGGHDLDYQKFRETILNLISHLDVYEEWKDNHSHSATGIPQPISNERIEKVFRKNAFNIAIEGGERIVIKDKSGNNRLLLDYPNFQAAINELTTNK